MSEQIPDPDPTLQPTSQDGVGDPDHDHDWTLVNRDENRNILKCLGCGAMKRE